MTSESSVPPGTTSTPPAPPQRAVPQAPDVPPREPASRVWPDRGLTRLTFGLSAIAFVVGAAGYVNGSDGPLALLAVSVALFVGLTFLGFYLVFGGGSLLVRFLVTLLASLSPFILPLVNDSPSVSSLAALGLMLATSVLPTGCIWSVVRIFGRRLALRGPWVKNMITPTLSTRGILELTAVIASVFALSGFAVASDSRGAAGPGPITVEQRFQAEILFAFLPAIAISALAFAGLTVPLFQARLLDPPSRASWTTAMAITGATLLIHTGVVVFLMRAPSEALGWALAVGLLTPAASLLLADLLVRHGAYRLLRQSQWRQSGTRIPGAPLAPAPHPLDAP